MTQGTPRPTALFLGAAHFTVLKKRRRAGVCSLWHACVVRVGGWDISWKNPRLLFLVRVFSARLCLCLFCGSCTRQLVIFVCWVLLSRAGLLRVGSRFFREARVYGRSSGVRPCFSCSAAREREERGRVADRCVICSYIRHGSIVDPGTRFFRLSVMLC